MIELNITPEQVERGKDHFEFGKLKNSILHGEGNLLGAIGEIITFDYCQDKVKTLIHAQNWDYDLIVNDYKIEIKTQSVKYKPESTWTCHVPACNINQQCDFYCFVFINKDLSKGWIAGKITRQKFHEIKKFKKKGEIGFYKPFLDDTFIININQLS